jgi:hypothetical protein
MACVPRIRHDLGALRGRGFVIFVRFVAQSFVVFVSFVAQDFVSFVAEPSCSS